MKMKNVFALFFAVVVSAFSQAPLPSFSGSGGGGGTPGGSTTQCQYNNAGVFGGITGCTTNGTAVTLVAPVLGTPASGDASNLTNIPVASAKAGSLLPLANLLLPSVCSGRLTTETGVAVSTSDRTAQGTIYYTPYLGSTISLYSGSAWAAYSFSELSLALSVTSGKNYDVFVFNNSGTLTLELSAAWTSDNVRADALTTQDGVYVKSGATTRRYIGTIRASGTNVTADSGGATGTTQVGGQRFVWSYCNRVNRSLSVIDTVDNFNYSTNTWQQFNGAAGNKVEFVIGQPEDSVWAMDESVVTVASGVGYMGIGVDSTSSPAGSVRVFNFATGGPGVPTVGFYSGNFTTAGYHFLAWLQKGSGSGTTTWYGDSGADGTQAGMQATIRN